MTQQINYTALNDFLDNQTDDISSIYLWYEKLSEYDLEGNESPAELETIFHAMKFLMSFSFTAAEELREVAEREAVAMAEKEEAWEEQKIALKEELDTLRERITVSAEAGDSTEAFRAQIDSLREENRELEKTNRDRDREMADLRDRFESLVSRADVLTRERDALEQHRNQMEDTIRELQRRISAKSEETTNEWESRKLRQRNEQAVTLTRQMQAVVLQNDELREEVTRVGDALEEATRIINESSARYAELTAQHDAARRDLRALSEENAIMREKLDASSSMLATVESEAMDVEQSTAAKLREMSETNRELREELYATQRELDKLRQLTESMNNEEKEAELEKLRNELIEATKTARSLYGELTSKTSTDPTVAFQLRIMQLESHLEQSNEKIAAQKKALQELEETLVNKDKLHGEIAAELERLRELKFGDAREELKRLTTQLTFRDEQIARLTNHCTLLQVELGTYAERSLKPQTRDASVTSKVQETQTNGVRPDVVPQSEDRPRPQQVERKPRRSSKHRDATEVNVAREAQENQSEVRVRRVFDQDIWEQQAMLMVSLYSELMQIMEEQEVKQKQMAEMEEMLFKGRRAMDDAKSQLHSAFDEIYRLKKNDAAPADTESEEKMVELLELRRFASTIKAGGSEVERRAEEITRKLITEQIERVRLSRMNTVLRRRCNRVEQAMRRARERMVVVETQAGKRCAQLQYQLDTALIDLANCQNQLVRSVSIETYEKLALRFKKECVSDVLGSEIDEVARENTISIAPPTDAKTQELEAKNTYLKKIVDVISEQNDFWSKETEILQNENEELKRFVEDMENESDLKNILASIQQRLLETIREQQEGRRDHERAYRKAREAEEKLAQGRSEWSAQRSRFVFAIRTLQSALSNARLNSLGGLSLIQIEQLRTKVQEVRENEMVLKETKEQVEDLRDELQQKLAVQKAGRKAKDAVAEENADVSKLERRLQAVYSSLTLQTVEAERLKNAVQLKDNQLSDLKKELSAIEKENEDLMIAIASANLSSKPIKGMDVTEDEDKATMEENTTTTIENSAASPFLEEPQSSSEESEATSTDSERGGVKTVLQDNSKEFEKRLAKMKEAAELCIQGYKKQLLQKDQALEMYRQLAEEKLSSRPQPTVEKEIVREEVRVVDEQTEERLRQALGDVARLKEEIEELEKANRALYRKRRRSMVPVVNAVECQTDPIAEQETDAKETEAKTKTSPKNSPAGGSISSNAENKVEVERRRYKSEIKQLQGKLQRVVANNKRELRGRAACFTCPRKSAPPSMLTVYLKREKKY
ncbi:hypothetical protein Y032_0023g657 [Ancylostoma ceylanicum]|uniref:Uncharacterized protein n=1 Tax=Ancylostoma ceylanicum TaxID=53326 RepID=A0A016UYW9_9BILA|nr:hypothetical protein Y032_0023g657 [Ancylostoma ceylanicum]